MKGADGQTFAGAVEGDGFLFRVFTFPLLIPPVLLPTVFSVKLFLVIERCGHGVLLALVKMSWTGQKGVAIVTR